MFQALKLEVIDRFTAVEQHFRASPKKPFDVAQTSKGLVFVQIYGVYEYTVRTALRHTIAQIASADHKIADLRPSLLALFLDAEIKSLRAVGEDKQWDKRITLFEKSFSSGALPEVNVIPHDGTHYKHSHLVMIFRILGIRGSVTARKRHIPQLDEIVQNRHRVAHGEERASEIGRGYTNAEILHRTRLLRTICIRLISAMSEHCDKPERHCR